MLFKKSFAHRAALLVLSAGCFAPSAAAQAPAPTAAPKPAENPLASTPLDAGEGRAVALKLADELVTKAQQQSARIRFIENADLLADVGGVGAILRFKI